MKFSDFCGGKGEECGGKKASQTKDLMFSWYISDIPMSLQMLVS